MEQQQERIKQFMEFFGQKCPDKPTQLDFETCKLRANLILEEVFETITKGLGLDITIKLFQAPDERGLQAGGWMTISENDLKKGLTFDYKKNKEVDLVELADGISDVSVVSYGTAVAAGIDMELIDKEVCASNMSKSWDEKDLTRAAQEYPDAIVEKYYGSLYRLKRADGKIIKSPTYFAADLAPIINKQIEEGNKTDLEKELKKLGVSANVKSPFGDYNR